MDAPIEVGNEEDNESEGPTSDLSLPENERGGRNIQQSNMRKGKRKATTATLSQFNLQINSG